MSLASCYNILLVFSLWFCSPSLHAFCPCALVDVTALYTSPQACVSLWTLSHIELLFEYACTPRMGIQSCANASLWSNQGRHVLCIHQSNLYMHEVQGNVPCACSCLVFLGYSMCTNRIHIVYIESTWMVLNSFTHQSRLYMDQIQVTRLQHASAWPFWDTAVPI